MSTASASEPIAYLASQARWSSAELAFWAATLLPFLLFPDYLVLASQIAITALFALSLDLILGYAGIISLGHAAFFGFGAYTAGLLAKHELINEPVLALIAASFAATLLGFVTSFLVLRGSDL